MLRNLRKKLEKGATKKEEAAKQKILGVVGYNESSDSRGFLEKTPQDGVKRYLDQAQHKNLKSMEANLKTRDAKLAMKLGYSDLHGQAIAQIADMTTPKAFKEAMLTIEFYGQRAPDLADVISSSIASIPRGHSFKRREASKIITQYSEHLRDNSVRDDLIKNSRAGKGKREFDHDRALKDVAYMGDKFFKGLAYK